MLIKRHSAHAVDAAIIASRQHQLLIDVLETRRVDLVGKPVRDDVLIIGLFRAGSQHDTPETSLAIDKEQLSWQSFGCFAQIRQECERPGLCND